MKVFLSWSGHKSHKVALVLRDWIPSVIQSIIPYVSSEDINKGARWSSDIALELEDSKFGILCVTKDNTEAPWLLFEAGALSKMMEKSLVCPFIFDLKSTDLNGPLLQFQATVFEKDDVRKLMMTLNLSCGEVGLREELLTKTFDVWWPRLEESLNEIKNEKIDEPIKEKEKHINYEMLEEILELSRANQKILRSPEVLFPPEYIGVIMNERLDGGIKEIDIKEQQYLSVEFENRLMQMKSRLMTYNIENKPIDSDFYNDFMHNMDAILSQMAMIRHKNENYLARRRKYAINHQAFYNAG